MKVQMPQAVLLDNDTLQAKAEFDAIKTVEEPV